MKTLNHLLNSVFFLTALIVLFTNVNYVLCTKPTPFYRQEKNSIDVILFGTSLMYTSVDPSILWNEYGINSYNMAIQQQSIPLTYYYMVETLKSQSPKAFVLEVLAIGFEYEYIDDLENGIAAASLDQMKLSINKICAVKENVRKEEWVEYIFPFFRQHTQFKELNSFDFGQTDDKNRGYRSLDETYKQVAGLFERKTIAKDKVQIHPQNLVYLNKMVELCKINNVELVLYKSPTASDWKYSRELSTSIKEFAKENNLYFLEYNDHYDDLNFSFETDTIDGTHLNKFGAKKVTLHLGKYLSDVFEMNHHRL